MSEVNSKPIAATPDGRPPQDQPAWRKAFPIDWPQREFVSRREFIGVLVLASIAFVVGQAYLFVTRLMRQRTTPTTRAEIAAVIDVPINKTIQFLYPTANDPCVLVHLAENEYVAYSQKCTHLSCPVIPQPETGRIRCPCHDGLYDLRTGSVISGPPERPLPRISLEIIGGRVYATGVAGGTG